MRIAMLSPIAWRTPPHHYGPWESIVSLLTEGLVTLGHDVTLFATGGSLTNAKLSAVCLNGYEEEPAMNAKVWESLHISALFERASEFDIIHNNFDFLPLTYSGLIRTPVISTIHGFSSPSILPVYKKYNKRTSYVSISNADRSPELDYIKTIYHGIDLSQFDFVEKPDDYLLFFGRIHHDKGAKEAIEIARSCKKRIILAGIIQDKEYYRQCIEPFLNPETVFYIGSVGPEMRRKLLGNASALLHPIHFNEPFGLSVIESMACGTPVIAFNKGSMPELIEDSRNGFLVSSVQQAVECVSKINELNRAYCRNHIEKNFTVARMVKEYSQTYESILS
jgi:glycosyltransferase involved in cell wall biosynthesis